MSATPTVFFVDDSATMREVIKIAFRRENIEVVACHDGDAAITQMQQQKPDVVISDVIMPGKDGYEVCQQIKQTPGFGETPVVLMSGVVNRQVAEKAFAVKADELIRKPFQPQDLIARVKQLLQNKKNGPAAAAAAQPVAAAVPAAAPLPVPAAAAPVPARPNGNGHGNPAATLSNIFSAPVPPRQAAAEAPAAASVAPAAAVPSRAAVAAPVRTAISASADTGKLRIEVLRLENLVKKLQSELQAEREYARALEEHIKTLQETD